MFLDLCGSEQLMHSNMATTAIIVVKLHDQQCS